MDAIGLSGVGYTYEDGHRALRGIDLQIKKGEKVALVGPNGAGKSTLLHIMSALYMPTEGELEIMGEKVTRKVAEKARLSVGFLFQDPDDQLFCPTVIEDVAFGPRNHGRDEASARAAARQADAETHVTTRTAPTRRAA